MEPELKLAIDAVHIGMQLAHSFQGDLEKSDLQNKSDTTPVTIVDYAVQALINFQLMQTFPNDRVISEETSSAMPSAMLQKIGSLVRSISPNHTDKEIQTAIDFSGDHPTRSWILDPIDGTRGFIHNGQYAVTLALLENNEVTIAALGCPKLDQTLYYASKGKGAFERKNGKTRSIHVQKGSTNEFIYCEPHPNLHVHEPSSARKIAEALGAVPKPFPLDSQVKYVLVAKGEASLYLRFPTSKEKKEKIWDHAPGMLLVCEAGGKVSDLFGKPLDFSCGETLKKNEGLVASNGTIHESALDAISGILQGN